MSFFSPSAAWLLLLAVPLIALYFLKLKRPRIAVPSLVLWRRVLDDQRVNSPFQRFKRNVLLFLQLLLLLLLILAAMQPFFRGKDDRLSRLPVMIDCSASMAATEKPGGPSRLDLAKKRVEDMITGLLPDQELALISFSDHARQRSGFSSNKQLLRAALEEIEVEEVPSKIEHAFGMAQALARSTGFDEVMLITDGNIPDRVDFDLPFRVNYQKLESQAPNIGITACAARRGNEGGWEIFLEVGASETADYGGAMIMRDRSATGETEAASELVATKPNQTTRLLFKVAGNEAQTLAFELVPNAVVDGLTSDNHAYLDLPALRSLNVYVSPNLGSLRHALRSLPSVTVYPNQESTPPEIFDLVISDEADHAKHLAAVRLVIDQVPADLAPIITMTKQSNQAVDWQREASLLQYVDFNNTVFLDQPVAGDLQEGTFINLGYEILIHGPKGPLLLEKRETGVVTYHALFHMDRSLFPYRVGFPVFVANLVRIAREEAGLAEARATATGVLPSLQIAPNQSVEVFGPEGGQPVTVNSDGNGLLAGLPAPKTGLYRYGGLDRETGASLLSLQETLLKQVPSVSFREATAKAQNEAIEVDRPFWHYLAALALVVLLVEWWYFQRRPGGRAKATVPS